MQDTMTTAEARDRFAELLNRTAFGKERVILTRRGKPLVAVIPLEDIALLEELEEQRDTKDFRTARAEFERGNRKTIPLADIAASLGIKA